MISINTQYTRLLVFLILGVIIAFLLTFFMHSLIQSGDKRLDTEKRFHLTEFVRAKRNEQTRVKERLPERPMEQKPPQAPDALSNDQLDSDILAVADVDLDTNIDLDTQLNFGTGDGEYLPIVKVAPVYPLRALQKNLEGYCVVEYTVTISGTTKNISVVESLCTNSVFYKSSIKAAEKFRYKPRVIDGEAIEVPGVRNRFTYTIED